MKNRLLFLIVIIIGLHLSAGALKLTGNVSSSSTINQNGCFAQLLSESNIKADAALFIGADGTAALIERSAFDFIYLHNDATGWSSVTTSLPPVCSIKDISEIALWQALWDVTLEIDLNGNYNRIFTPFTWIITDFNYTAASSKNGFHAEKYIRTQNPLPAFFAGDFSIKFSSGDHISTYFQPDKFKFDGCNFFYDDKQIIKIIKE